MRKHVNILGVDIPLATIQYATSTVRSEIGSWVSYRFHMTVLPPRDRSLFKDIAVRRTIPANTETRRQLFTYNTPPELI